MNKITFSLLLLPVIFSLGCTNSNNSIATVDHPAYSNSEFPYLYSDNDSLYMSWLSHHPEEKISSLNYARYTGDTWSEPVTIARDSSWFINWADFPSVIAGKEGAVAAHWLHKIPGGTYAYNVNISVVDSTDSWSPPVTPHFDQTATEHGFASMVLWDEQTVLAVWLDGRQAEGSSGDDYYDLANAMTLRGALISTSGEVKETFLIDDAVCDCCPTSLIKTEDGAMVAYRNRTGDEIRDIYLSSFNGEEWSRPESAYNDKWKIAACPVNGPALAADDSLVVLSWFTAAGDQPAVKAAVSTDKGNTFDEPADLNEDVPLGRVGATVYKGAPYVSWIEKGDSLAYIKLKNLDEPERSPTVLSAIDESRSSGVPQLTQIDNKLIMAWTDISGPEPRIKMVEYIP